MDVFNGEPLLLCCRLETTGGVCIGIRPATRPVAEGLVIDVLLGALEPRETADQVEGIIPNEQISRAISPF